ncbi:hypothetical protein B0H14DRAFT_2722035 [Mycena olivaceomarginata]|nr:hypothetical protein B0H14DRAFT_2722035 [Mycena olivaceomarginata]
MEDLLYFGGLLIIICVRLIHALVCRYAAESNLRPAAAPSIWVTGEKPNVNENVDETSGLLDSTSRKRKAACCAAAVGYMAATALAIKHTVEHHEVAPLLHDLRFVYGRGGMFLTALMAVIHVLVNNSASTLYRVQAEGLTLLVLPFIMRFLGAPGASDENVMLDLLVEPMLGMVVFLSGVVV